MRPKPALAAAVLAALTLAAGQVYSADVPTTAKGTCTLTGHVNDPYGKPAGKCTISLTSKAKKTADAPATQPTRKRKAATVAGPTTTTDDNGDFKLENVAAGEYTVSAVKLNVGKAFATINLADGQTTDVKLTLAKSKRKTPTPGT